MRFHRHWTADMVTDHINRKSGVEPLNYHYFVTHYPDVHAAAVRIFGSWRNAIEACGVDYSTVRKYQKWSRKKVLDQIRELKERGEDLSSRMAQKRRKSLYMAAVRKFGNWGNAVTAAGVEYERVRIRRKLAPNQVRDKVLELFRNGENLSYTNMRECHQYLLAAGAKKLGEGSWGRAREKCGIEVNYRQQRRDETLKPVENEATG